MEQFPKLRWLLIRFLLAGGLCLLVLVLHFLPAAQLPMEKLLKYLSSDVVFLR